MIGIQNILLYIYMLQVIFGHLTGKFVIYIKYQIEYKIIKIYFLNERHGLLTKTRERLINQFKSIKHLTENKQA